MGCPNCHTENPKNVRFCIECGSPFERCCLKCGFDNLTQAKFCGGCGSSLGELAAPLNAAPACTNPEPRESALAGERRHLTVLFATWWARRRSLHNSTPKSGGKPVAGHYRVAAEAITRFGGHVAKYLGDGRVAGLMPHAMNDDFGFCGFIKTR